MCERLTVLTRSHKFSYVSDDNVKQTRWEDARSVTSTTIKLVMLGLVADTLNVFAHYWFNITRASRFTECCSFSLSGRSRKRSRSLISVQRHDTSEAFLNAGFHPLSSAPESFLHTEVWSTLNTNFCLLKVAAIIGVLSLECRAHGTILNSFIEEFKTLSLQKV